MIRADVFAEAPAALALFSLSLSYCVYSLSAVLLYLYARNDEDILELIRK